MHGSAAHGLDGRLVFEAEAVEDHQRVARTEAQDAGDVRRRRRGQRQQDARAERRGHVDAGQAHAVAQPGWA